MIVPSVAFRPTYSRATLIIRRSAWPKMREARFYSEWVSPSMMMRPRKVTQSRLATMHALTQANQRNEERIFPFIGGEEVNTDPRHAHRRYVIDFFDRPLRRDGALKSWCETSEGDRARCRASGIVPPDYPDEVAEDWPDPLDVVRRRVKPERDSQKRKAIRQRWWQYADKRPGLYHSIAALDWVLVCNAGESPHHVVARLPTGSVFAHSLIVFPFATFAP